MQKGSMHVALFLLAVVPNRFPNSIYTLWAMETSNGQWHYSAEKIYHHLAFWTVPQDPLKYKMRAVFFNIHDVGFQQGATHFTKRQVSDSYGSYVLRPHHVWETVTLYQETVGPLVVNILFDGEMPSFLHARVRQPYRSTIWSFFAELQLVHFKIPRHALLLCNIWRIRHYLCCWQQMSCKEHLYIVLSNRWRSLTLTSSIEKWSFCALGWFNMCSWRLMMPYQWCPQLNSGIGSQWMLTSLTSDMQTFMFEIAAQNLPS